MRGVMAAGLLALALAATELVAAEPVLEVRMLDAAVAPAAGIVASGALDARFEPFDYVEARRRGGPFWLRLESLEGFAPSAPAAVAVHKGRHLEVEIFASRAGEVVPLRHAAALPRFRALQDTLFVLPAGLAPGERLYARVEPRGRGSEELRFSLVRLDEALASGAAREWTISLAFGALIALALTALCIWFVVSERLFVLYATLISLQASYVAYLTGQGFDWPLLSRALPLGSHAWNVPAALSGAIACLFVREIADLRRFSPRVYRAFGWLSVVFVALALANFAQPLGLGPLVAAVGNGVFLGSAVFTVTVAFLAWRRGSRPAGWFLIAWGQLEVFTFATAFSLLAGDDAGAERLLYHGLPASLVAAAVLIALGVADRLREQRAALTEAERRAQLDPLTGVLNRRSLLERLDAACARARAHDLPVAILFIDLDHFKEINDSYGHQAGDACLRAIIGPIQAELRQSDVIGRYGGEEFVVILSGADMAAAHPIAERIRRRVADVCVEGFGPPIRLTCSIGVASSDTLGVWGERLIACADSAVYDAKRSGRNRVQIAAPLAA